MRSLPIVLAILSLALAVGAETTPLGAEGHDGNEVRIGVGSSCPLLVGLTGIQPLPAQKDMKQAIFNLVDEHLAQREVRCPHGNARNRGQGVPTLPPLAPAAVSEAAAHQ